MGRIVPGVQVAHVMPGLVPRAYTLCSRASRGTTTALIRQIHKRRVHGCDKRGSGSRHMMRVMMARRKHTILNGRDENGCACAFLFDFCCVVRHWAYLILLTLQCLDGRRILLPSVPRKSR
jgi:hypothetical protein